MEMHKVDTTFLRNRLYHGKIYPGKEPDTVFLEIWCSATGNLIHSREYTSKKRAHSAWRARTR